LETTLIVTEKPDAALHVAEALAGNKGRRKMYVDGVPFFEVRDEAERILVCSALGHLYAVAEKLPHGHSAYPVWDFEWKPKHLVEKGQVRQEKWIHAITKVSKEASRFFNGCDFDIEGSLIGYTILKYACEGADKKARRMKFSTLTESELRDAYANALPELDFKRVFAGMCRHEVDWLFGINLSRALTQSAKLVSGRYSTLSTGRVQGPTLRFLVEREREIETFVPVPYWVLRVQVEVGGQILPAEYEADRLEKRSDAEAVVQACDGKAGLIQALESKAQDLPSPTPFDLPSLQSEAYRHFGLSPKTALSIAERLYLDQLISYPRTSSQKLPPSIGYEKIVKSLGVIEKYRLDTETLLNSGRLTPNEGRRDDPAHPAIYPTGVRLQTPLEGQTERLFDIVVRRFLATFGRPARRISEKATIKVGDYKFLLRGSRVVEKGWTMLYGGYAEFEDITLPPLKEGQEVFIREIRSEQKYTQPPPRYNPSSLLKEMERAEIGTKATRADIIETLYRRGYVTGQKMTATSLAFRVTEILGKNCPKVIDVIFTRELEAKMEQIELGEESREQVVSGTVAYLEPIVQTLKSREREIGQELTDVLSDMHEKSSTLSVPCPQCGSRLKVVRNPRSRKRFIGCAGRWKCGCNFALPLPQVGRISLLQKLCPTCGFQLIQVTSKGRRPLVSCCRCYAAKAKSTVPVPKPVVKSQPQ